MSIITAILAMYAGGETLNTMTLGGFALAVGILVDNGTVVIENIERHVGLREPLVAAIINGAGEVGIPTVLADAVHLYRLCPGLPAAGNGEVSVLAAVALGMHFPDCQPVAVVHARPAAFSCPDAVDGRAARQPRGRTSGFAREPCSQALQQRFTPASKQALPDSARLTGMASRSASRTRRSPSPFFGVLMVCSLALFPLLGLDFFPQVDAGQMRLHVRAPPATRIEETQRHFANVERAIRKIVGNDQIDTMLDNIGLPYSGINIALSDSATVGPMDGEILISLKKNHSPTAAHVADLRRELPRQFPELQFFFQPADIVNQVLNFGQPAPIDVSVSGPDSDSALPWRQRSPRTCRSVPGIVDSHVFQVPDAPGSRVDRPRHGAAIRAGPARCCQQRAGHDQLQRADIAEFLGQPARTALAIRWSCRRRLPDRHSSERHRHLAGRRPGAPPRRKPDTDERREVAARTNRRWRVSAQHPPGLRRPCRRPGHATWQRPPSAIDKVIGGRPRRRCCEGHSGRRLRGQIETMRDSFTGLFSGMAFAVVLVYLLLVINFQSWIDPLIVLSAVPFALGGA